MIWSYRGSARACDLLVIGAPAPAPPLLPAPTVAFAKAFPAACCFTSWTLPTSSLSTGSPLGLKRSAAAPPSSSTMQARGPQRACRSYVLLVLARVRTLCLQGARPVHACMWAVCMRAARCVRALLMGGPVRP